MRPISPAILFYSHYPEKEHDIIKNLHRFVIIRHWNKSTDSLLFKQSLKSIDFVLRNKQFARLCSFPPFCKKHLFSGLRSFTNLTFLATPVLNTTQYFAR